MPRTRTDTVADAIRKATGSLPETWIRMGPEAVVNSIRSLMPDFV